MAFITCGCFILSSCGNDIEIIQDNAGGDFQAINMATNDTLNIYGGLTVNAAKSLSAKNGNIIKLKFIPKEDYKTYNFDITFKLPSGEEVKNPSNREFEFSVSGLEVKDHNISLSAKCTEKDKNITASGGFLLRVSE